MQVCDPVQQLYLNHIPTDTAYSPAQEAPGTAVEGEGQLYSFKRRLCALLRVSRGMRESFHYGTVERVVGLMVEDPIASSCQKGGSYVNIILGTQ
jgi:hypothetical protein